MSLFSALNTAVSGLNAQASAFSNISDDVANSQTVGYKEVDTKFTDYLTNSTAAVNGPEAVVARPSYENNVQGTIAQTTDSLGLAIAGQGFFQVSKPTAVNGSTVSFATQAYYSRAGDFQLDKNGYVVNSSGDYLNGWLANTATTPPTIQQNAVKPIQVAESIYNPVSTQNINLAANLPANAADSSTFSSQATVYDSLGTAHTVDLNWTKTPATPDTWSVQIVVPDLATTANPTASTIGSATVQFGAAADSGGTTYGAPSGTIGNITNATGLTVTGNTAGSTLPITAQLNFAANFGEGSQSINVSFGTYGSTNGVNQYAGTQYALRSITQDGAPAGSFSSVSTTSAGNVVVNYDNGQSRVIAQVPVITFNNPNALQRQTGQSFTATIDSGSPVANAAATNGAGSLVTGSIEQSNVDIATQFTKLIVAQQAYSANAKMITTANDMLQVTLDMKR